MKKLSLKDVTKDELIEYFFNPITGHSIYGADKERFLLWVYRKRTDTLLKQGETLAEASQKAFKEYIDCVKKMNDAKDIDEKFKWIDKANEAYKRYERLEKEYDKTDRKVNEMLDM